ncbi:dienelactone hydrolase family protein [Mycobacterium palustre]|uniref:dienelactone hydrolase family protein n=1 Tax=Mycobacterium palustre TaxID=153971 RepID=UPI0021F28C84|nr:hypothetical protein [Mycobacterium palustre]MCV7103338.1 hypothetical protein [Mycobacterium palustre]
MARIRKLVAALSRRGPHRVLRGDLAFAGLPGVVYTPETGFNLPGVAFGHDWLTGAARYAGLLEHLASWGIVAGAPDTERGVAPSVLNFAFDIGTALDVVAGVRLGPGKISVHPAKLGVVGHGFGGSAAVFAAAGMPDKPAAAAAIFPAVTSPPAEQPAAALAARRGQGPARRAGRGPAAGEGGRVGRRAPATLRVVGKAQPGGLVEGRRLARVVGLAGAHRRTQRSVRALLTGYLLYALGGDKTYRGFADADVRLPRTDRVDPEAEAIKLEEKIAALLK